VITAKAQNNLGGLNIDERDLSMAVSKISMDDLEGVHTSSIDDALQGRMAGVDIVGGTGNPGGGHGRTRQNASPRVPPFQVGPGKHPTGGRAHFESGRILQSADREGRNVAGAFHLTC